MKTILATPETINLIFYYFTPRLTKTGSRAATAHHIKPKPDIALTITH
jgi:hypothetical protein